MGDDTAAFSGWQYALCPLDTEPRRMGPFRDLVQLWQERRGGRRLPARRDFEIQDFAPWLGRIFIARVERDPFDLRFSLWGTMLRDWWQVDYTGRTLGQLSMNPRAWKLERDYFRAMDRQPFLGIASGLLGQHRRDHIKVVGLDLPLAEGDRLAQVLSAHLQIGLRQSVDQVLPDCPLVPFPGHEA